MRSHLLPLATRLVRAWTRVYTHGLPDAERTARRAEIDSDLWEFEHDHEARQRGWAATQVLARLLLGIANDLAWRMNAGAATHGVPVSALAAAGMMTGPRRVSAFGLSAGIHVVAIAAVMWLASRGPEPWLNPGETAVDQAGIERGFPPNTSSRNQRVSLERNSASIAKMSVQSVATPEKPRAFGAVIATAVAVAARVGLITVAAQAPPSASGTSAQTLPPPPSPDRLIANVLQSRYSLSVRDGQLGGTGAGVLRSAIAQARFVLLGEDHGNAQTPELSGAICNAAGPERFHAMAIEEGALAAAELERLARRRDGLAQLAAFRSTFPGSINVYNSREEFEMLQQCARAAQGEFHLWGLDQEARGADRNSPADYDNVRRRERLMKTRFATEYARATTRAATPPRVLLKLGAYHIYRGFNPVRGLGIGHHVAEFAEGQGAQSLHIRMMAVKGSQPIYPRVGQPAELRPFNIEEDARSHYLWPLLTNRLQSEWTLFDLRALRHDFTALAQATNPDLATLVFGIDMLVVVPESTRSTEISSRPILHTR